MTARLLDISRLVSRAGSGPLTGIDRVERAYLQEFLKRPEPVFFLCRTPRSFALLDRAGGRAMLDRFDGRVGWGRRGLVRLLAPGLADGVQRAVADVWRLAMRRCTGSMLGHEIGDLAGGPVTYVNVGHSNLRAQVFEAVKSHEKSRIIVLIHDIIPLSYPEYSRPEVTKRFRADMVRVARLADGVIYNSAATCAEAEEAFAGFGNVPPGIVAHLGLEAEFITQDQGFTTASESQVFHIIGTIEPRKNHLLLLEIWREMLRDLPPGKVPELHIIGRRGWNNENVFKILNDDPMMGHKVFEHNSMSDQQMRHALASSWGLLFPSHAEGFGLPLIEAAACGIPIFCGENAISREVLGDYPLYLNVDNSYAWKQGILGRAGRTRESARDRQARGRTVSIPDWPSHFDRIFRFI